MQKVLLSFDIEEFDYPKERGGNISLEEGVKVSSEGLETILAICAKANIKATFFCTGNFAGLRPDLIKKIAADGHEAACHGMEHFAPKATDIAKVQLIIENTTGQRPVGYRQPRMKPIDYAELAKCGYLYDSSVNPAFIPGRYNNLRLPRTPYYKGSILEIPVSAATIFRIPLFWLSLHLLPKSVYFYLTKCALAQTGYFATYFHPWEFADLSPFACVPAYVKYNSGQILAKRLYWLIGKLKEKRCDFITYADFAKTYSNNAKGDR
ncbi:MAG: polysaccharide deacetylase family protein [bacterium]|nr:polysaccharide deacetylase family protein [bacterium]